LHRLRPRRQHLEDQLPGTLRLPLPDAEVIVGVEPRAFRSTLPPLGDAVGRAEIAGACDDRARRLPGSRRRILGQGGADRLAAYERLVSLAVQARLIRQDA